MRTVADAESTGAASVYRFSTDSIRRALDSGRTAGELLGELGRRGTVPQALAYLIEDVARRHAVLRIGSAATFLRCDDPVVLAGILADPGAAALGLFALSDTVLASEQPPEHVLERLRQLGHSLLPEPGRGPAAEAPRRGARAPRGGGSRAPQRRRAAAVDRPRSAAAAVARDPGQRPAPTPPRPRAPAGARRRRTPTRAASGADHGAAATSWPSCARRSPPTHRCGSGTPTRPAWPATAGSSRCAWPAAT